MRAPAQGSAGAGRDTGGAAEDHGEGGAAEDDHRGVAGDRRHVGSVAGVLRHGDEGEGSEGMADVGRCEGGAEGLLEDSGDEESERLQLRQPEGEGADGSGDVSGDAAGAAVGNVRRAGWKLV